jgi:hypothetical protein
LLECSRWRSLACTAVGASQWVRMGREHVCCRCKTGSLGGTTVGAEQRLSLRCGRLCSVCSEIWSFSRGRMVFIGCWEQIVVFLCKLDFSNLCVTYVSSCFFFFFHQDVFACILCMIWAGTSFLDFIFFHFGCVAFV